MSSDSDDFSVSSAVKTRRYRQRQRAGIIARPMATPDEQHRLLSLPFDTLTPKQKARVRYYRRRDRNQQQHQQSLQLEQQSQSHPSQPQSDAYIQQQAQLVASRIPTLIPTHNDSSITTTSSPIAPTQLPLLIQPPPHESMSTTSSISSFNPFIPVSGYQQSHPSFIPVAMVPTSFFSSLFLPHMIPQSPMIQQPTTPSVSYITQPQPASPLLEQAPVHQSDVKSLSVDTTSTITTTNNMAMLATAATLSSTGTSPSQTTTSSSVSNSSSSPIDNIIHKSSYLVHPYEQVIKQTHNQQAPQPSSSSPQSPPIPTPMSQWKSARDHIYKHILLPQQRHKHMIDVEDKPGRYLSVMDIDIKEDIHPNPNANIIQEMVMKSTSSSSSTSVQQLKQALPLSMSTHTHPSYGQQSIPSSQSPPTIQLTTLKQSEAYERLIHASTASHVTPNKHIFTPSININCVKDPVIRQRLIDIARAAQQQYKQRTPRKHQEIECDDVFTSPLDGFGISGLQVYIKSGECVTWLHDELLWCAALNYMLKESQGCALWIAVGLHDLKQVMSLAEIEKLLLSDPAKRNVMEVGSLLDSLIKSGTHIEYVFQYPGTLVSSPPGNGAAHFVYSYGSLMTQVAWDYSFIIPKAIECLSYWGIDDNHDHLAIGNTSMSTISVVPLFTMQLQGYEFGLMDRINHYKQLIIKLQSIKPKTKITHNAQLAGTFRPNCLYRQDWIRINNQCIHCYFKKPTV